MYWMYILKSSKDGSYYIGSTGNLDLRVQRHNKGHGKYTRKKLPWDLVYKQEFATRSEAEKEERRIKNKKSKKIIEYLISKSM